LVPAGAAEMRNAGDMPVQAAIPAHEKLAENALAGAGANVAAPRSTIAGNAVASLNLFIVAAP
jgi:hypothetical protein